jgi:hypothetical protein
MVRRSVRTVDKVASEVRQDAEHEVERGVAGSGARGDGLDQFSAVQRRGREHVEAVEAVELEIVQIALDLLAWMPTLALTGQARPWEPRRLRFRLLSAAGQLVTTGRRQILRLARHWPWTGDITTALERLALLPNPG